MKKITSIAPSNIAFIKYWGRKDDVLRLPCNGSIAMNLSNMLSTTTVAFSTDYETDSVTIDGSVNELETARVISHLDRIRKMAGIALRARVVSENNFPVATGLSSSASGFAALTVAASNAAGLTLSGKDMSILARQGSGSSCRSIPNGFVEWHDGGTSEESYCETIFPETHWDIADVIAVVSNERKDIATSVGHKYADTSPFYEPRIAAMPQKISTIKDLIQKKDFVPFGELIESEALNMHAIMTTSTPSLLYWLPGSIQVMKAVKRWRAEGLPVYFTLNTGQDVHVICEGKNSLIVEQKLKKIPDVRYTIMNKPAKGTRLINKHLF